MIGDYDMYFMYVCPLQLISERPLHYLEENK